MLGLGKSRKEKGGTTVLTMMDQKLDADAGHAIDLRAFIRCAVVADPQMTCEQVMRLFERHADSECIVVCEDERVPCGLVMRDKLIRRLGSRFGASLYSDKPISRLMDDRPIVADAAMPLQELLDLTLGRAESTLYDCVIVVDGARLAGILTVADLLGLSKLHQQQAAVAKQRIIRRMERLMADIDGAVTKVQQAGMHGEALSQSMSELTRTGREALVDADRAFDALAERMAVQQERIAELQQRAEAIDSVSALIKRLADQCNLLAVNASIEAARAGGHGRGFGVVADEIRMLAAETKRSAGEIAEMIGAIRASVQETAEQFMAGIRVSESSRSAIGRAGEAFERIFAAAADNHGTAREINAKAQAACEMAGRVAAEIRELADGFRSSDEIGRPGETNSAVAASK
jgi:methyl-accepting chemotaxis protein